MQTVSLRAIGNAKVAREEAVRKAAHLKKFGEETKLLRRCAGFILEGFPPQERMTGKNDALVVLARK